MIHQLHAHSDVPVATPYLLCEDLDVIGMWENLFLYSFFGGNASAMFEGNFLLPTGTKFYIMEFVQGRIFLDPRLPEVGTLQRAQIFHSMNETLAKIHKWVVACWFGSTFIAGDCNSCRCWCVCVCVCV